MHQRQGEPTLWTIENFPGHTHPFGQFAENVFLFAVPHLPFRTERRDPLNKHVVQNRHADFKRSQHAHTVYFSEDVLHQIRLGIHIQHLAYGVVGWSAFKQLKQQVLRIAALCNGRAEFRRKKRHVTLKRRNQTDLIGITLFPRQRQIVRKLAALHSLWKKRE